MKIAGHITPEQFRDIVLAVWERGRHTAGIEADELIRDIKERLLAAAGAAGRTG